MGLQHSETSCVLYDISGHMGLDEFDSEAERRPEPLEVRTAAAGSLWFAPEEKVRVFSVIEQYAPADLDRIDSAQPLAPRWDGTSVVCVVILIAVFAGLPVLTQVLPEPRAAYPQVRPLSTVEARPASAVAAIAPAASPVANRTVRRQPPSASSLPAGTGRALELGAVRQALASLEDQDVPLENCVARVPAVDRVVVRCRDGSSDEWTLDFNRALDRWQVIAAPAR